MIEPHDITVVVQGDVRADTELSLSSVRAVLPGATLVVSTFHAEALGDLASLADQVVLSHDPGPQVHYTRSRFATQNNLNRQIVSTRAGLAAVRTPYALKLRSDAILSSNAFVRTFAAVRAAASAPRILACSHFTRHPDGISGYLFHVSDWFMFAETARLRAFWDVAPMSDDDASWFDAHPHAPGSTAAARRFRARYAPEQHLTIAYARRLGYAVPAYLNERTPHLVSEYRRFIATEVIIDTPDALGFELPKYRHVAASLYQAIDCVSPTDWLGHFRSAPESGLLPCLPSGDASRLRDRIVAFGLRRLAHTFRHALIALVLGRQRLVQWLAARGGRRRWPGRADIHSPLHRSRSHDA
jgi:hypothetical protein